MSDDLRVAQIRLHRAIRGDTFWLGLTHLSRASQEAEKHGEMSMKVLASQPYDTTGYVSAHRTILGETIAHLAGVAFALSQKYIDTVTSAVAELGSACEKGGHGPLNMDTGRRVLRCRVAKVDHIFGVANFWKHGHDGEPHAPTIDTLKALGVDHRDPNAFRALIDTFGVGGPEYQFLPLFNSVKVWGEALLPEILDELEGKSLLMLISYSDADGEVWTWKQRDGVRTPQHEVAHWFK